MENGGGREGAFRAIRRDRTLRGILALALLLRLVYAFVVFPVIGENLHWKGVDDGYDEVARHLIHGHGFVDRPGDAPNLVKPPGYVFFLAGLYTVFGEEVNEGVRVRIAQPLLDTGTCLLVFLLGLRVFGDRRIGLIGAFLWAVYPQMIVYGARVAPESLFILLLTALMFVLARLRAEGRARDAVYAGVLFALALLVKEKLILFPAVLLFLLLRAPAVTLRRRLALAALLAAAALTVTGPWLVRGYRTAGTFVPITLRSGRALNQGMDESFAGADETLVDFFENRPSGRWRDLPESERERLDRARENARDENSLIGKAMSRIARDPVSFLRSFVIKLGSFWYFGQPKVIAGNLAVQMPLLGLAIAGFLRERRRRDLAPFALLVAYFLVIHALTIVRMRYSLPVMPEVILLAGSTLLALRERFLPPPLDGAANSTGHEERA
ncbi:MAG: glycosyltransferase family 39 protein [Candidatus Eisenbacteria bacterium]